MVKKIEIRAYVDKTGAKDIIMVEVKGKDGSLWQEPHSSKESAEIFLRGVQAGLSFTEIGLIEMPEVPKI